MTHRFATEDRSEPSRGAAQAIADKLRNQILSGELADGSTLPPLDELIKRFDVSKPTVRQGLQILETEGLLSVRRGRNGGSVVHLPRPAGPAYAMDLLFRSGNVPSEDMSEALRQIEPLCARMCALRDDRETTVLPYLRAVHAKGQAAVDDVLGWTAAAREFHEEVVRRCGNATLMTVVGAVESVCTARAAAWASGARDWPEAPIRDDAYRRRGLDDHALIMAFIERGDPEAAAREAWRHLQWVPAYPPPPAAAD